MSKEAISGASEQEIETNVLLGRRREDQKEFSMEFERVGLKFIRDKIDPDDKEIFMATFDELVGLGCLPEILASTLYCFCKSHLRSGCWFPPYGVPVSFPSSKEIGKYRNKLKNAVEVIQRLDDCDMFAFASSPPEGKKQVLDVLRWYITSLPMRCAPRKDIIESYAPIPCCMYAKVATGQFQFPLVYQLLKCFGYKPDPKRQTLTKDWPRGTPLHDDSMERNYRNFEKAHPVFCDLLEADLRGDHVGERERQSTERDHWVGERGFSGELFDELRSNRFNWNTVFPHSKPDTHQSKATFPGGNEPDILGIFSKKLSKTKRKT
jgi:hypothetical protein